MGEPRGFLSRAWLFLAELFKDRTLANIVLGFYLGILREGWYDSMSSDIKNQTRQDAFSHVYLGRVGSLAHNPSRSYLISLREFLYEWIKEIDATLYEKDSKEPLCAGCGAEFSPTRDNKDICGRCLI